MKQKMKSISFIRLTGNHMLSCATLGIHCTPNGLKMHLLYSCNYFRPLLVQLSPNCTLKHAIPYTNPQFVLGVRLEDGSGGWESEKR